MGRIGYGYGSEWHLLRYLGYHRQELSRRVAEMIGCDQVSWWDFPFSGMNAPCQHEAEFQGLAFMDDPVIQAQWRGFWPSKGQHWDAVGCAHFSSQEEVLLVEAKAHAEELGENEACQAKSATSIQKIRAALQSTQDRMRIPDVPVDGWMKHYYQTCNRYAALLFLRDRCRPPVPARLLFIYFYGETHSGWTCPTSPDEWQPYLKRMDEVTGICHPHPLSTFVHRLFLPIYESR